MTNLFSFRKWSERKTLTGILVSVEAGTQLQRKSVHLTNIHAVKHDYLRTWKIRNETAFHPLKLEAKHGFEKHTA